MAAFGGRRKHEKHKKKLEESQENQRTGVNKKKTASRPSLEARDHMKLKYHSVGSFNHKPSQGLDVKSPTPGDYFSRGPDFVYCN